ISSVDVYGGRDREIQIVVDPYRIAARDLSFSDLADALREQNTNISAGTVRQGKRDFTYRTIGQYETLDKIADTVIAYNSGGPVYVHQVAEVRDTFKKQYSFIRSKRPDGDGAYSISLPVRRESGSNVLEVINGRGDRKVTRTKAGRVRIERERKGIIDVIEEVNANILNPRGLHMKMNYDESEYISAAIDQVRTNVLVGAALAFVVLMLFLRSVAATAIVAVAIPIAAIGTFLGVYMLGRSLNVIMLAGVTFAVGMVVDNAIVVLENIVRKREQGQGILEAARNGTTEVSAAVIASTLTTIAVFFPMVFISGVAGQLFRDQALTVTFALMFSLIVALTLIPMLAALGTGSRYQEAGEDSPLNRFTRGVAFVVRMFGFLFIGVKWLCWIILWVPGWLLRRLHTFVAQGYEPVLRWSLGHRAAVVGSAAAIFVATMMLIPRLGTELIPQLSQGEFNVDLRLPPGSPLIETDRAIQAAHDATRDIAVVDLTYSVAGTGNRLDANPVDAGENTGTLSITLKPGAGRAEEAAAMDAMRKQLALLPGVQYEFSRPSLMTFASPLQIEISGFDLADLELANQVLVSKMQSSGRFADIKTTIEPGNPEIQIVFDQERVATLGLSVRDIADRIVANVRGELATRYTWRDRKIDVMVRSVDRSDASIAEIRNLIVNPTAERPVTLEAVAEITIARGPAEIRRVAQERVAIISANLAYGDLGAAVAEANAIIASTPMPPGITAMVSGQNEEMQDSFRSMKFALALAIFLVYLVMASQFESLIHPLVILFTIPLALVGAVLALFLTGTTVNVVAFVGVIMLAGIVVNNAIILVDLINQLQAQGIEKTSAIMEAGRTRLRPILMTTLTTALGLTPMAIGFGEGSEVRTPMAITVIGGLLVSTLLTLIVIPVVYSLLDRKKWAKAAQTGSALPQPTAS
ncbi:MAG: efflux RND transporter permease subunit, partial [Proteobacteria bacterium]|nr:efflux RND transporter permease subunit [Pseudomonadota bacterium]